MTKEQEKNLPDTSDLHWGDYESEPGGFAGYRELPSDDFEDDEIEEVLEPGIQNILLPEPNNNDLLPMPGNAEINFMD